MFARTQYRPWGILLAVFVPSNCQRVSKLFKEVWLIQLSMSVKNQTVPRMTSSGMRNFLFGPQVPPYNVGPLGRCTLVMPNIDKRHFEAAGEMIEVIAAKLGNGRAVHSETAIAAGARMAGTMLFRSFGFDISKMAPGSAVLSNEANERGPELVNVVAGMLNKYGLPLEKEKLAKVTGRGEAPKLTVNETQELLENDLASVRDKFGLGLEDGARACALAVAFLVRECPPQIGLEVGFNVAAFGFIEGCKTVPIKNGTEAKRPWYRVWK